MASTWQGKVENKIAQAKNKIPLEWRLPSSYLEGLQDTSQSVLDIPRRCGILSKREIHITEDFDATALLEQLASRKFTAVEVTTAFCKRAAIAQQLTSCLTETFFDTALRRAQVLDDYLTTTGKTMGPLHGLPISLKECFNIADVPTTAIDQLRPRGALAGGGGGVICEDQHPSDNDDLGRTIITGGEGALLAMRGSLLGIGTDFAWSIRVPALCCGLVGFKPSASRVPYGNIGSAARPGLAGFLPCAGPLCHSVRDVELLLKIVFNSNAADLDDNALGVPWNSGTCPKSSLRVGFLPEDAKYPLHPPMQHALKDAVAKLLAAGHEVIDISQQMPSIPEAKDVAFRFFNMDPDRTALAHVTNGGEPFIPSLKATYDLENAAPEPGLRELYELNVTKAKLATRMRQAFTENKVDVIIGPAYQSCAVPHDTYGVATYTVFCNLFNPVSYHLERQMLPKMPHLSETSRTRRSEVEGAPCHIQLVGRPMEDEVLMQHASIVEELLRS
ncbi:hypothetical protein AbraIFM66951_000275 [Aspergillus brasiliensis]|uniref:Amidase domain-containing protein n=1 Tax=Aspergillus brasiliensis TaxID=319629 RepID=A0A9W5YIC2_9EURO|nr:hypothetical protein AbraCBS73388_000072 [Aspergillus brasiliensis]GKZ40506.1 hypothetical protein AbraIFM66951_000275 [Aspergillus brasiliensis]